jgi:hypothetical protein
MHGSADRLSLRQRSTTRGWRCGRWEAKLTSEPPKNFTDVVFQLGVAGAVPLRCVDELLNRIRGPILRDSSIPQPCKRLPQARSRLAHPGGVRRGIFWLSAGGAKWIVGWVHLHIAAHDFCGWNFWSATCTGCAEAWEFAVGISERAPRAAVSAQLCVQLHVAHAMFHRAVAV